MNTKHYLTSATQALIASTLILMLIVTGYLFIEPQVSRAVTTSTFAVSQDITGETGFLVLGSNLTMTGGINGITGGTSNGTTTVVVQTNAVGGYNMTIAFAHVGTTAMRGNSTASQSIVDYPASTTLPSITFSTASSAAVFGFTVSASSSADVALNFKNNGSVCGVAGSWSADACWMSPTSTAYTVINRTSSATAGATSTIHFRVSVPNNPTPGVVVDTYTATATLTVASN